MDWREKLHDVKRILLLGLKNIAICIGALIGIIGVIVVITLVCVGVFKGGEFVYWKMIAAEYNTGQAWLAVTLYCCLVIAVVVGVAKTASEV